MEYLPNASTRTCLLSHFLTMITWTRDWRLDTQRNENASPQLPPQHLPSAQAKRSSLLMSLAGSREFMNINNSCAPVQRVPPHHFACQPELAPKPSLWKWVWHLCLTGKMGRKGEVSWMEDREVRFSGRHLRINEECLVLLAERIPLWVF